MSDGVSAFHIKARESLAGAESELANDRFNNCTNRCYYACFQAAIGALQLAGLTPRGRLGTWSHSDVPAQFDGLLINRRKEYPSTLRGTLYRAYELRQIADYSADAVSRTQAERMLRRSRNFSTPS